MIFHLLDVPFYIIFNIYIMIKAIHTISSYGSILKFIVYSFINIFSKYYIFLGSLIKYYFIEYAFIFWQNVKIIINKFFTRFK